MEDDPFAVIFAGCGKCKIRTTPCHLDQAWLRKYYPTRIRAKVSDFSLNLRSGAKGEDNWGRSNASGFETILNVNADAPDEMCKAVETVISSIDMARQPVPDQILVQTMVHDVARETSEGRAPQTPYHLPDGRSRYIQRLAHRQRRRIDRLRPKPVPA